HVGMDDGYPVLGVQALRAFGAELYRGVKRKSGAERTRMAPLEFLRAKWPEQKKRHVMTVGKGGVGKTTVSACVGQRLAEGEGGSRVMVCSTDPAPSLDDVFGAEVGDEAVRVGAANLWAVEVDAKREYRNWAHPLQLKIAAAGRRRSGGVQVELSLEMEVFSKLLDVVPPGVDEMFAVSRIAELAELEDCRMVLDMAPTGHALELLRTPERLLRWTRVLMKALSRYKSLGLAQELAVEVASLSQRLRGADALLRSECAIQVVTLAEPMAERESMRLFQAVGEMGLGVEAMFVNRVLVTETECGRCRLAKAVQGKVLSRMRRWVSDLYILPEFGSEIVGRAKLERFGRNILVLP
ncbi:MAG: ArsA family ATPase, partial [Acidobacteriales bacterium]|nr:ArsA family ATPase [Terriglobales bacterium]